MTAAAQSKPDQIAMWRRSIENVAADIKLWVRLRDGSLNFLASEWMKIALDHGWDEIDLWGVLSAPLMQIRVRPDCMGLVPALLWASWPLKLVEITADGYRVVVTASGSHLSASRRMPSRNAAKVWWDVWKEFEG